MKRAIFYGWPLGSGRVAEGGGTPTPPPTPPPATTDLIGAIAGAGTLAGALTIVAGPSYDAAAQAYFAAMSVQPDATRKGLLNDLIVGLKADGVWAKLDWLVLLAAHDGQAGRVNAVMPSKVAAAINSPTFTVDRGYAGDGASSYISFTENITAGGNFSGADTDNTLGCWATSATATGTTYLMSMQASAQVYVRGNGTTAIGVRIGSATPVSLATTSPGHFTGTRIGTVTTGYIMGGGAVSATGGSVAISDIACLMRGGATYTAVRIGVAYYGAGLTAAEVAALHARLNTYMTAIGAA